MLKALAAGLGIGAGIQAFRAWPPDGPVTMDAAAIVFAVGLIAAYLGGRWHGRGHATAVAVASAEATATAAAVQSVNIVLADRPAPPVRVPSDTAPWLAGERPQITADDLDGLDVAEIIEQAPETA